MRAALSQYRDVRTVCSAESNTTGDIAQRGKQQSESHPCVEKATDTSSHHRPHPYPLPRRICIVDGAVVSCVAWCLSSVCLRHFRHVRQFVSRVVSRVSWVSWMSWFCGSCGCRQCRGCRVVVKDGQTRPGIDMMGFGLGWVGGQNWTKTNRGLFT